MRAIYNSEQGFNHIDKKVNQFLMDNKLQKNKQIYIRIVSPEICSSYRCSTNIVFIKGIPCFIKSRHHSFCPTGLVSALHFVTLELCNFLNLVLTQSLE